MTQRYLGAGNKTNAMRATQIIEQLSYDWTPFKDLTKKAQLSMCEMRAFLMIAKRRGQVTNKQLSLKNGQKQSLWRSLSPISPSTANNVSTKG